jgi:DNA polymerase III delta prime subunit
MSLMGGRKVIIIDEADYLNPNSTQPALRGAIEEYAGNCSFIFTCNFKNRLLEAIHSRCTCIDFKVNGSKAKLATQFLKRVETILQAEKIEYSKNAVAAVITKYFPDNRRILNELQRYSVSGKIDEGILVSVSDLILNDLIKSLKEKNFADCRKWVTNNLDNDPTRVFRKLYDTLYEILKPQSVPQLVLILAKYQYQAAFVADMEINLIACLTEIMVECEFK